MSTFYRLEFEDELRELERQIAAAEKAADAPPDPGRPPGVPATDARTSDTQLQALRDTHAERLAAIYESLGAWDTVKVARHPERPQTRDYIDLIARDFCELHGDRAFRDDPAIVTGFGRIGPHKCMIVGHQKGKTTEEKIRCAFGCAHPEGYRKALLKMKAAEKFGLPIVTLIDTPGAYPGVGAEERGQAQAIAINLLEMSRLRTPIVAVVVGEGGSGGALGVAVADRVAMLRHAYYSVISPEGCAAILWKAANDQTNAAAASALKLTAPDNLELGVIDAIIDEPPGGAHRDPQAAASLLSDWIVMQLDTLCGIDHPELVEARRDRFRRIGTYTEHTPIPEEPGETDNPAQGNDPGGGNPIE